MAISVWCSTGMGRLYSLVHDWLESGTYVGLKKYTHFWKRT